MPLIRAHQGGGEGVKKIQRTPTHVQNCQGFLAVEDWIYFAPHRHDWNDWYFRCGPLNITSLVHIFSFGKNGNRFRPPRILFDNLDFGHSSRRWPLSALDALKWGRGGHWVPSGEITPVEPYLLKTPASVWPRAASKLASKGPPHLGYALWDPPSFLYRSCTWEWLL